VEEEEEVEEYQFPILEEVVVVVAVEVVGVVEVQELQSLKGRVVVVVEEGFWTFH